MNDSQLEAFLEPLGEGSSWAAKCVRRLLEAENLTDIAAGLVAQNGRKPVELVKNVWNAWGIDMKTCIHTAADPTSLWYSQRVLFSLPNFAKS
jgi:hypothetical protein